VRLLAVESCSAFAAALSSEDATTHLLPVINKFAQVLWQKFVVEKLYIKGLHRVQIDISTMLYMHKYLLHIKHARTNMSFANNNIPILAPSG
jgi:hypothetical protein